MNYYLNPVVVLLACCTYCGTIADTTKYYCEVQEKVCNDKPHPLCNKFRADQLPNDLENATFYQMSAIDINFILTNINRMRSIIAHGDIKGCEPAANFRVVKWSDDYVLMAKMKIKHVGVCTKISLTNAYELEMEEFRSEEEIWDRTFYQTLFNKRIYNDSFDKKRWLPLFREEFDTIGCVLYHDHDGELNMLECFTNKSGGKEKPYKLGEPCSQCEVGCSNDWPYLCDVISSTSSPPDDYHITIILVMTCIMVALVFLAGMIFLFRLIINKNSEDLQHTDQTEMATEVLYSRGSETDEHSQINYSLT